MYIVYILLSAKNGKYYIGQTSDMRSRLQRHNSGRVPSTMKYRPWRLIHSEQLQTRADAMRREKEIKKYKGGILFQRLVGAWPKEH